MFISAGNLIDRDIVNRPTLLYFLGCKLEEHQCSDFDDALAQDGELSQIIDELMKYGMTSIDELIDEAMRRL